MDMDYRQNPRISLHLPSLHQHPLGCVLLEPSCRSSADSCFVQRAAFRGQQDLQVVLGNTDHALLLLHPGQALLHRDDRARLLRPHHALLWCFGELLQPPLLYGLSLHLVPLLLPSHLLDRPHARHGHRGLERDLQAQQRRAHRQPSQGEIRHDRRLACYARYLELGSTLYDRSDCGGVLLLFYRLCHKVRVVGDDPVQLRANPERARQAENSEKVGRQER
mmetsp:Transcript_28704/g.71103  ORF Transcript_28704/g.71103 Transcript_28704/m.71103 type:complete len:221 (+) Transcript_28704:317-979(+)